MVFVLTGGGTAGHVTPAIAIAEGLLTRYPSAKILFIGRELGKENDLVKKAGFPLLTLRISGIKRSLSAENLKVIRNALRARERAKDILRETKPDTVIGTGGYVCWPVLSAARRLGIPTLLHESNAALGLTSRLLARKCDAFCTGAEIRVKLKNARYTGNPIRESFKRMPKERAKAILGIPRNSFLLLSVGGSGGAERLNSAVIELMRDYSVKRKDLFHIHSCGRTYYDKIAEENPDLCSKHGKCRVVPFIDNMATALCAADAVITRCGAMTLSEIAHCATPAILVPSPNVTANHQLKNALAFEKKYGALIIEEKELCKNSLKERIELYMRNPKLTDEIKERALNNMENDAKQQIISEIERIMK